MGPSFFSYAEYAWYRMEDFSDIPTAALPEQLKLLETHARELANQGKHEDAERLFREISRSAPNHIPALRYLASRAMVRQEFDEAQLLIERAIRLARNAPMLHQHLAIILRARGYTEGALLALDNTIRLQPDLPAHWIQRGDVLQALGRNEEAIASYKRAADLGGNLSLLAKASRNNPQAQNVIIRAAKMLIAAREQAVNTAVASIVRRNGKEALKNVIAAGQHITHANSPVYADPLQRPAFSYCPGLEARPFFEREEFPFLHSLEEAADDIRRELQAVLGNPADLQPYVDIPIGHEAQWRELNHSPKWSSYHLYQAGRRVTGHCERCPHTTEAIESLPLVRLQQQAPEAFFSILKPGTHIPPHYGIANYKLAVHLPLIIPDGCAIRVGDQTRNWTPGKCLIFDDSFEHEAWNRSDKPRAVLIFEIWHPDLSEAEKLYLSTALAAYDSFNAKLDRINQAALRKIAPTPTARSTA